MTAPNSPATPASAMTSTLVATDSLNDRMWIARSISAMRSEVDASQLRQQVH